MKGMRAMTAKHGERFIDCDIHQRIKSPKDFYPYLPRVYRQDIDQFGLRLTTTGGGGYLHGGAGGYRADSYPDDGTIAGSEFDLLKEQLLDTYNIEYGILGGQDVSPVSTLPDADYAAAVAAAYNDWMIEHWIERDDRLKGLAVIALQNPKKAAEEIRRTGKHPGIVGALVQNGARFPYGQRYYDPIFEALAEMNLPFCIHIGGEGSGSNGQPTPAGYPSYYIESRQARAMGCQAHIASMVFEGLFDRYPNLQVVFIEGGFIWLPTFLWRLDSDWKALRNQTPWVQKPPSEYVFEHVRFTSQPMEQPEPQRRLLSVFEWAKAEKTLMFATDYPHWDFDSPELSLPAMPDNLRKRIMLENAREFFNLPAREPVDAVAD
jgi:predicted TIM-barrel fold metal-dependent hydrolase